ncbi:2-dehydro-3-deoxygluconokinase [Actinoplanes lobatus]|uniref:2-dehydro-3-deoxygluconokinase n=1 Tax=Actinoplanes lobatus TaxID=113568 RepID=A0A7W7HJQ4_9ACTN|nr:sugar kinase [Actinoplanes lobatus]MBB4751798.1 2-dehydro-3-deoxygluconokinase [Actinoplanes lobatus]GGN65791.1 2-dehydro-3-deoxygluconokinase [Actinoplanes lobatus]GIE43378.1 2-dehydro-3-deoxygluconokinase [Actinoplanes lobatus]
MIEIRPAADCEFDIVALGEVMLRLDPGEGRVRTARRFEVWEGGGEYNVARGMRKVFGHRAAVVTALADNEIGRLVENLVMQGGVDTSLIRWERYDGIGRTVRNGLNFTERGFGVRGAVGVSDRAHTAIAGVSPGTFDWDDLFGRRGVRWLHTGGIFAALSESSAAVAEEAMAAAHRHGTVVSFDLNYRPSLWAGIGGTQRAREVNSRLARHVDVMIGNEEDFTAALGFDVEHVDEHLRSLPVDGFARMVDTVAGRMPWLSVVATTLRTVHTAADNDWQAIAWSSGTGVLTSAARDHLGVFDRVGGGDGFASGLICGLLEGEDLQACLELGAAHGALAMTTPGDTSMATREEVRALAGGGNARVRR